MASMSQLERPRLFFLHINKTAGTSLYRYLESHYRTDEYIADADVGSLQHSKAERDNFLRTIAEYRLITKLHINYSYLRDLRRLEPEFKAVTVVRDPIARAFSQIEAWRRVPPQVLATVKPPQREIMTDARTMPVSAFIDKHCTRLTNRQAKMIAGVGQMRYEGSDGELIHLALDALNTIEFAGITERLADFSWALAWQLGFYNAFNNHRLNVTGDSDKLDFGEKSAVREILAEINRADTALYLEVERRFFDLLSDTKFALYTARHGKFVNVRLGPGQTYSQTLHDPVCGEGWHEREQGIHGPARWAGPERFSSLYLPVAAARVLRLRLWVTSVISPSLLDTLKLTINEVPVRCAVVHGEGLLLLESDPVELAASEDGLKVVLEFPRAASAYELYAVEDHRKKTVAIERIEVIADNRTDRQ
jgi:hypothetical protein